MEKTGKLEVGTHQVKMVSYGVAEGKDGKADSVWIIFQSAEGKEITWFGSLSEKAAEYTLKTLLGPCGMIAEPDQIEGCLEAMAVDGVDSNMLDPSRDVEIVVEDETYNGQTRAKVKWVNGPGASGRFGKIASEQVKGRYAHLNLAQKVAAVKANAPKTTNGAATSGTFKPTEDKSSIPF